jgi:hypothetical protein
MEPVNTPNRQTNPDKQNGEISDNRRLVAEIYLTLPNIDTSEASPKYLDPGRATRIRRKNKCRIITYGSELVIDDPLARGFDLARGLRHLLRRLLQPPSNFRSLAARVFLCISEFFLSL